MQCKKNQKYIDANQNKNETYYGLINYIEHSFIHAFHQTYLINFVSFGTFNPKYIHRS